MSNDQPIDRRQIYKYESLRITHLVSTSSFVSEATKPMNITDLFDTVFNVNDVNGKRLERRRTRREKSAPSVQHTSICFLALAAYIERWENFARRVDNVDGHSNARARERRKRRKSTIFITRSTSFQLGSGAALTSSLNMPTSSSSPTDAAYNANYADER